MSVPGSSDTREGAPTWNDDLWCSDCGVNPVIVGGRCSMCQADEDFMNCEFCHGNDCTRECEDEEDLT